MPLFIGLLIIAIYLILFGIGYAIWIYKWPWKRTYTEVALGVGATILGESLAILLTLAHFGLLEALWWMALFPEIAFILTGVPMMIFQEIKLRQQGNKAEKLNSKYNGD